MRKSRYEEIVAAFQGKRLVVVGDLMVDRYVNGQVNRISPESPTMVVEVEGEIIRVPGGAANVVNNLVALGAHVSVVGVVGDDAEGARLRTDLGARGVDVTGVLTDPSRPTTVKERIIAQHRQLLRVDYERSTPVDPDLIGRLTFAAENLLAEADAIVVSDYNKGVLTSGLGAALVECARTLDRLITGNPKPRTADRLRGADVVSINQSEAEALSGVKFSDEEVLLQAGRRLAEQLDAGMLIITQGSRGLRLWKRQRPGRTRVDKADATATDTDFTAHVPAHAVEVYDVAGAGDTAISTLTLALVSGAGAVEAAIVANHAAACVVRKVGVATVSPSELIADWTGGADLAT